jgi:hypothetical protein
MKHWCKRCVNFTQHKIYEVLEGGAKAKCCGTFLDEDDKECVCNLDRTLKRFHINLPKEVEEMVARGIVDWVYY